MSWSSGAEAAGEAGPAAGGASSLGSMGSTGSLSSSAADIGANAGGTSGGFSSALDGTSATAEMGPYPASQYAPEAANTTGGSMMDRAMNGLDQFQKGGQQSLPDAYRNWGNNPATYGYVAGKLQSMGGGAPQAPNMTTNISYQQPQNDYLMKQRRRF